MAAAAVVAATVAAVEVALHWQAWPPLRRRARRGRVLGDEGATLRLALLGVAYLASQAFRSETQKSTLQVRSAVYQWRLVIYE